MPLPPTSITEFHTQSAAAQPAPGAPTKTDRASAILQGIAAIAAELGVDFIHSGAGLNWLAVGVSALQLIGEFV